VYLSPYRIDTVLYMSLVFIPPIYKNQITVSCYAFLPSGCGVKFFYNKSWRLRQGMKYCDWVLLWHLAQPGQQKMYQPHLTSKVISWYSFLLMAEWTPGLLSMDKRIRSLENFQGPHRESNSRPLVLWHSTVCEVTSVKHVTVLWPLKRDSN
jgi:hypothetical protein